MSSSSRTAALRPYLLPALLPVVLVLLVTPGTVAVMLSVMWLLLLGTVGLAATSPRPQQPGHHPRGRLHD